MDLKSLINYLIENASEINLDYQNNLDLENYILTALKAGELTGNADLVSATEELTINLDQYLKNAITEENKVDIKSVVDAFINKTKEIDSKLNGEVNNDDKLGFEQMMINDKLNNFARLCAGGDHYQEEIDNYYKDVSNAINKYNSKVDSDEKIALPEYQYSNLELKIESTADEAKKLSNSILKYADRLEKYNDEYLKKYKSGEISFAQYQQGVAQIRYEAIILKNKRAMLLQKFDEESKAFNENTVAADINLLSALVAKIAEYNKQANSLTKEFNKLEDAKDTLDPKDYQQKLDAIIQKRATLMNQRSALYQERKQLYGIASYKMVLDQLKKYAAMDESALTPEQQNEVNYNIAKLQKIKLSIEKYRNCRARLGKLIDPSKAKNNEEKSHGEGENESEKKPKKTSGTKPTKDVITFNDIAILEVSDPEIDRGKGRTQDAINSEKANTLESILYKICGEKSFSNHSSLYEASNVKVWNKPVINKETSNVEVVANVFKSVFGVAIGGIKKLTGNIHCQLLGKKNAIIYDEIQDRVNDLTNEEIEILLNQYTETKGRMYRVPVIVKQKIYNKCREYVNGIVSQYNKTVKENGQNVFDAYDAENTNREIEDSYIQNAMVSSSADELASSYIAKLAKLKEVLDGAKNRKNDIGGIASVIPKYNPEIFAQLAALNEKMNKNKTIYMTSSNEEERDNARAEFIKADQERRQLIKSNSKTTKWSLLNLGRKSSKGSFDSSVLDNVVQLDTSENTFFKDVVTFAIICASVASAIKSFTAANVSSEAELQKAIEQYQQDYQKMYDYVQEVQGATVESIEGMKELSLLQNTAGGLGNDFGLSLNLGDKAERLTKGLNINNSVTQQLATSYTTDFTNTIEAIKNGTMTKAAGLAHAMEVSSSSALNLSSTYSEISAFIPQLAAKYPGVDFSPLVDGMTHTGSMLADTTGRIISGANALNVKTPAAITTLSGNASHIGNFGLNAARVIPTVGTVAVAGIMNAKSTTGRNEDISPLEVKEQMIELMMKSNNCSREQAEAFYDNFMNSGENKGGR